MSETKMTGREQLRLLKAQRQESGEEFRDLRKEQTPKHKAILAAIAEEAKTVPEIAEAVEMDAQEVFWHLAALRKYDKVVDDGKRGDYRTYRKK